MSYSFEMNNAHRDVENPKIKSTSPVVEVFSAMVKGKSLPTYSDPKVADRAVEYIKSLGAKAAEGDMSAVSELNQIRREILNPEVLQELQLLSIFGSYQPLGANETIEREIWGITPDTARFQALNGTVRFPATTSERYIVQPENISAGYQVDYRTLSMGDMTRENAAMQRVHTEMLNKATDYVMKKVYQAIKNATGVKYFSETSGITQAALDNLVKAVRKFGPTTILGAYATVSQINAFAPYSNGASTPYLNISDAAMEEIRHTGLLEYYKGSVVREIPMAYDFGKLNAAGTDFVAMAPEGLLFVLPTGVDSPVASWTVGGITSFSGNDVSTGRVLTRFDLTIATDVAKGQEYKIGLMNDTSITPAADMVP
jgi:hypothetical protein